MSPEATTMSQKFKHNQKISFIKYQSTILKNIYINDLLVTVK